MKTVFPTYFAIGWSGIFAVIIVLGLGAASVVFLPFGLLLVPYLMIARRYRASEPGKQNIAVGYWMLVTVMMAIIVDMILGFFGHGLVI